MANILILDDSIDLLDVMEIILKGNNHKAVITSTLDSFMQKLQDNKPELILIDVNIRNVDGRGICKQIKEQVETKNIPIILISASPEKLKDFKSAKQMLYLINHLI